jgi:hypothetical protein
MPKIYENIYIDQGANFSHTVDLEKATGLTTFTSYSTEGKLAKSYDGTVKGTFTVAIDDTDDELDVSLTAAQTAALKPGRYVYDIIIHTNDSPPVVTRVAEGQAIVNPGVTFDSTAPET